MKEKNQNTKVKNKNGKHINKKVAIIPIIATAIIAAIVGVYLSNKDNNKLSVISPEIARSMTYDQVQEGEENVEGTNEHVKFDAFFLRDLNGDGYAESIRGTCNEIGKEATLYMELNVLTEGYLENGKIAINGENIYLQTNLPKDDELADNYIGNNIKEINLKQINNGTQKLITGIVRSGDYTYDSCKANAIGSNIDNYSKVNSVTLTGTYVYKDAEGTEQRVDINKTVEFNVDWYGTTKANIYNTNQSKYLDDLINQTEGKINLNFTINTEEMNNQLLLKSNHTEVEIPNLNGYAPLEVVYTGSNATVNYNEETRILTLDRTSSISEDGILTNKLSATNSYGIRVTYPVEAYTSLGLNAVQISLPVRTYYEGYNNTNNEFTNPYKSNTAKTTIVATYKKYGGTVAALDITVGNRVSSPAERYVVSKQKPLKLYNGQSENEDNDTYIVKWEGHIGTNTNLNKVVMKETQNGYGQVTDQFIKTDGSQESMEEVTSNIGICFTGMDDLLGENGYINVYDEETGNLLATFTKDNWNRYTSSNPYRYEIPVKHIRIETSAIVNNDVYFYIYNIKELNDDKITTKYDRNQFDKLEYIKSQVVMYVGETFIGTDTFSAYYEAPYSIATMSISKNTLSTQVTEKNNIITINANANLNANQVKWINGTFLIKLPDEMLSIEINDVEVDNPNVEIGNYEVIQLNGQKFIKIVTQNDIEQTFSITIDVDLTPDPRIETMTRSIELYASNESACDYYYKAQDIYDVNNNLNTNEQVNYRAINISMVAPNSLLTNQTATEFDDKGSVVVSPQIADIKPIYAVSDQEKEVRTAKIGVQIKNNYTSTISEIQILGKIPFEGNTYVISGEDLESTFTTKMTNAGIEIPAELQSFAKVYYSNNENPDKDINKEENGWKTAEEITNWDEIKTFLIDLGSYVMPTGKDYVFYYTVKIPNGLDFNKISYSHHGVYFSLDTDEGKYRTQTEPNKLGLRIAEKYNLELTKYQTDKEKLIPGATYSVQEIITEEDGTETTGNSKTGLTNTNGMLTITNLYAEKLYELKEIRTPNDYELNSNIIRFIVHVDDEGILTIEKIEGETKQDLEVIKDDSENYKVTVQVEDEVKASIKITKKEQGTNIGIDGVKYKLKGYNLPENGRTIRTNTNGEAEINGISINQEYTLEEVKAEGYYLTNPIKFKIVNNEGNYSLEIIQEEGIQSGTIVSQNTTEEDSIPTINIILEDEKIPTYNLQILKIKKTTESTVSQDELIAKAETDLAGTEVIPLANATFKLMKGEEDLGKYTTGEDGTLTIEGLYQYESEKDIDQTYLLKEVMAPEGYAKVKDISFRVQEDNGSLILIDESGEEQNYSIEGETVKLIIEDSPSFKLVKKDAETKEPLANVKFALFNVDDGTEQLARNGKGEIIGTKEIINGREYYTVETDSNGELTADLPEGLYKAVEVQAPDKYDISESEYYFGIGASREAPEIYRATQVTSLGGNDYDDIESVASTRDGGYIVGGFFKSDEIILGDFTLINEGSYDGMIIKYDENGEVEWAESIGGDSDDRVLSVDETVDGGFIVGGRFDSSSISVGSYYFTNSNAGQPDGIIIKYNQNGKVEWATSIGDNTQIYNWDDINSVAATNDGGFIVGGRFNGDLKIGNELLIGDAGLVIKYNAENSVQWARAILTNTNCTINSVSQTTDGGFIAVGSVIGTGTIGNYELTSDGRDAIIVKYDANGQVKWATSFGGDDTDELNSVIGTSDGGFITAGYFDSTRITIKDYELKNQSHDSEGMIVKYNVNNEVEWAVKLGGGGRDRLCSVAETKDGGFIVGGHYGELTSGDSKIGDNILENDNGQGVVIKFDTEGNVVWLTSIGGSREDHIYSVSSTINGGFIVAGDFKSNTITAGNLETANDTGTSNGIIIKYENTEINNLTTIQAQSIGESDYEQITSVAATNDGGYVVGGYFESDMLDLGEDRILENAGSYSNGMVIKYGINGEIEWAKSIGEDDGDDEVNSIAAMPDGEIVVVGSFESNVLDLGEGKMIENTGSSDGMVIKYGTNGEVEWAKSIGGSRSDEINSVAVTPDGEIVVGGHFTSNTIDLGEGQILENVGSSDGMIIKYRANGEVEWAGSIGGDDIDEVSSVAITTNGEIVAVGYYESYMIDLGKGQILENAGSYSNGMVIKYGINGEIEWAKSIGEDDGDDEVNSIAVTPDGETVVVGYFESDVLDLGEGKTLENTGNIDGMIIKYGLNGEVEWARNVGGSHNVNSVAVTQDGDIIVGGNFESKVIVIGNYRLENKNIDQKYTNGRSDGFIAKYKENGETEWAKSIGGSSDDYINSVIELNNGQVIVGGYFNSASIETDGHTIENTGKYDGMLFNIVNMVGAPEVQELTVENSRKVFNITTDVNEIDGVKGGSVSGEDSNPYEEVKYGDNNTKEIVMTPEEGYEIIGITVNGEEYKFTENADGTYTMPQFTNVTEDKHIVVTYSKKDNKIVINKVDADTDTQEPIQGITFKLDQIEERAEPENVIGTLTDNGATYTEVIPDTSNEITEQVTGELTNNGTYYFVQNEDGTLTPTNSKTYQTAHEGTSGIQSTTANSYVQIDLSGLEGQYVVGVNAKVSSESVDYGYATITQSTSAPSYSNSTGRFMYISGTSSSVTTAKDYISTTALQGGQIYYLHLGYRKDSSVDTGDDQVVINSIKVYRATEESNTYNFIQNGEGGYESNNQGKASTTANSYIPIDLTGLTGKYNLIVNANVSSQSSYDYGYATVTSSTTAPAYNSSTGRFIYISGTSGAATEPTDYITVLQGGSMYYLHLGYYKNASTNSGDDKLTVNSIKITPNDSELYHTEVTTNSEGQAITQIPFGKYQVTEVNTPEGYESIEAITINFRDEDKSVAENNNNIQVTVNENGEFTIENKQLQRVIVHHYLKEEDGTLTTTKVAEDDILTGKAGEKYETKPHLDLEKYELEKDESGNYVIPEDANGTYDDNLSTDQEVTYYYETKDYPLIVHHYMEGTTNPVPLQDGSLAEDIISTGKEGNPYTTGAIEDSLLDERYELVETPENANGNYIAGETIVTYYYKEVQRPLTITKTGQDGAALSGVTFEIQSQESANLVETIGKIGKLEKNGNYYFVEQGGKYISNNQQQNSTTASSYIKIDLTDKEEVTLKINAGISSENNYDFGYATITESTTAPSYSSSNGRFIYISGTQSAKDYETTLEGGKVYYLHLGYRKDGSGNTGADTFTINSIKLNDYNILDLDLNGETYVTNDQGKINVTLDAGEYLITETEVPEGYKLPDNPTQTINITKDQDSYELNIQNEKIPAQVIVHHYIEGTTDKVPEQNGGVVEDEVKTGVVGDMYASQASINVSPNYEYVSSTDNTSGLMTEDPIEVIYYYQLKQAGIEQQIDKTGSPETITQEDEQVTYNITYTGTVIDYIGNAKVTIVDTLPFSIDTTAGKSDLNGGKYDAGSNTITWEENISDIDTFTNAETGKITITKQIKVTYADMDYSKTSFENKVSGKINLEATEQEEPTNEDTVTTNTDFRTEVTVTKVWNHTNNIYTIPTQIKVQLKNGENVVQEEVLTEANKVGEDVNTWSYTFTNLPKYDEEGLLIDYTVEEAEVNSGDLAYYDNEISGNTITNTYAGPIISATKSSETEHGLDYVVEGETITYTITVKNDGGRDKVVTLQDSLPEGTTFKAGSIKVNDSGADNYTETNLNSGIPVNVTAHGTATVSFEVTVNPLEGDNLTKVITNTATVDGKDTDPVTETVNKSKLIFTKTSEPEGSTEEAVSTVTAGEKITYTINLTNEGTAPATTTVKDSAPVGTTLDAGSIVVKVNGEEQLKQNSEKYNETDLASGISVTVPASGTASVSFTVTVNDIADGTEITNRATVGDSEEPNTNEVTHKYVEPIISQEKTSEILDAEGSPVVGRDYALEGDIIKYTITVKNNGGLSKNVKISDTIPTGTTFVDGSIEVVNAKEEKDYTQADLNTGIEVTVPEKAQSTEGTASVSFKIKVNELATNKYDGTIENTAKVDEKDTPSEDVEIKKPYVVAHKESTPASGEEVRAGQEITYRIVLDNTEGTAPGTVTVKDTIPAGTTYKDSSMMLDGIPVDNNAQDLANGLNVTVEAGQTSILSFTVTVNGIEELADGYTIRNQATVEDEKTNEITHTYIEPEITAEKTSEILNAEGEPVEGRDYVLEGETIKYTITVTNDGGLSGDAIITDTIPTGTRFVAGSIEVVNAKEEKDYTENDLSNGITVTVPAHGTASVSFEVTVNELAANTYDGTIENTAHVKEDEYDQDVPSEEVEVKKPHITAVKTSDPASGSTVKLNDTITYTITLTNDGTAPDTVQVIDEAPNGTTFVAGSIKVNGETLVENNTEANLADGIEVTVSEKTEAGNGTATVSFEVTVNDINDQDPIENTATLKNPDTQEETPVEGTEHTYIEPEISGHKSAEISDAEGTPVSGRNYALEGEIITYTITIINKGGLGKEVTVADTIPSGTSFVEGSIRVNNEETQYTQTNLRSGIEVEVPAKEGSVNGETTVTFEVRVNNLEGEDLALFTKVIKNAATVDGTPTNETTTTVNKPHVTGTKTSDPANGNTVKVGDPITYTITLTNDGTAPETVTVRDEIPEGTTFVEDSIQVQNDNNTYTIDDLTTYGIDVEVPAGETRTAEFTVTVNDLDNGDKVTNVAYVDGEETNSVEHTYIEAIIDGSKTSETANGLDYVVEGEVITYTITASNTGDLYKDITISDQIPEGTTFVTGSIRVNRQERTDLGQTNLESGIQVNVPARISETQPGEASISFQVTVDELPEGELVKQIRNTAVVDGKNTNEVIETVNKSDVSYNKTSTPPSGSTVTAGDQITYTINLTNKGTAPEAVEVKDTIPTGTTFVEGSIRIDNEDLGNTLADLTTNGIEVNIPSAISEDVPSTAAVSFTVTVNDINDQDKITNVATVNDNETTPVEHTYVEPEIYGSKAIQTANGLDYVVEGETITYIITVTNDGGLADDVVVKDEIPAGTSFVDGSIKVNGSGEDNYTEANLNSGITVNVPAKTGATAGETTVSFEVTVNQLEGQDLANLRKDIANTATVDGEETTEVTTTVYKANVIGTKESIPASGETVEKDEEITYIITLDNSTGTAPEVVVVKDEIPTGTTFVEGSIKVKELATGNTAENLSQGISVNLSAGESTTVEFKVKVNDLNDQDIISNIATVDDEPTEEVTHTYVEPEITQTKTAEIIDAEGNTVEGRTYALAGDRIRYTITVTNDGGLSKDVVVIDGLPSGTTFVENSIKVNNQERTDLNETNLESGIKVNVPAKAYKTQGSASISFEVTVNEIEEGFTTTIANTATVDGTPTNETTTTVNKPNVIGTKESTPASGETVENGQEITYTIRLDNSLGTAPDTVKVKDSIPEGTEFVEGSIKVGGVSQSSLTEEDLSNGIKVSVEAGNTNTLEFKVKVADNDTLENKDKITNTATVKDNPTNTTENTYIEPIISATKSQTTQNNLAYVVEGETITYCITVSNTGDLGKDVIVSDNIPIGTSFVPDSIVIVENGTPKEGTFTEDNLESGIEVNVGAQNTTTITFQVTVDELADGTYYSEIVNSAVVDGKTTTEVRKEVYKPHITATKEANPDEQVRVTANDSITYTITIRNDGRTDGTTTVKDTIPEGTTFVAGSIKVAGESRTELTQENLSQGINVEVPVGETRTVEFTVTVNDLDNGETIRNVATYTDEDGEETSTEEVGHTYVEPEITAVKSSETENGLGYVVEGETITYTIKVSNTGDLGKEVIITDEIPDGTTFVTGSIKVNGQERTDLDADDLRDGISVDVPARTSVNQAGTAELSFEVTVNVLPEGALTKDIINTAIVDGTETEPVEERVNKADVKGEKTSVPPSGETVEAGEEITYTITVRNDGTAPETALVKDTIPTGTTFVEGSIVVEGSQETYELADLTTTGIEVALNPDESKTVEFKVTVQDLDNGTKIRNEATVDDEPTNDTEHTYVEAIITGNKTFETENGLDYVVEGEIITYTITATNNGDAEGTAVIKDNIPAGTRFVEDSIRVNGEIVEDADYGEAELTSGIEVTVPARASENQAGTTNLSFQVTVNNLPDGEYEGTISNTATVNETDTNEVTEEVNKPNITATKESSPASGSTVTAEDTITYTINLNNQGTAPGEVIVKDEIPEGTTFVTGSIKVGGQAQADLTAENLANGITVSLEAGETTTVEFKVTVNDIDNGATIRNEATYTNEDGEEISTNEITHKYVEAIISGSKFAETEKGLDYVGEGETITYTVKVTNTGDLAKDVIVADTIPEGTTFVNGSITVNGEERADLSQTNLSDGISVNVPARTNEEEAGTATVTFQVTVNELSEGTYQSTIRNTAIVDGNNTNEVTEDVRKAHVRIGKTSEPASGETVTANDEIRYIIVLENAKGTAPSTLVVKDSIPEGTSFVEGSIRVNGLDLGNTLEDLTTNGIEVTVPAADTSTVEFRVTVNDLENGYIIRNKANITNPETQESKETNEVTHEYVEAIINAEKEMTTEKDLSYVVPGERVTYTIRIRNTGDLSKKVIVADSIPEGTEFVDGSVLLNETKSNVTKEQLETGIEVEAAGNSEQTISFTVTVLEGATEVKNIAVVDGENTNETKVPVISYEKTAEVTRQTAEEIADGSVTAGDKIKYTIIVNNLGEESVSNVTIKDAIPEGTTLSSTSVGAVVNDRNEISWTIDNIAVGESKEVSFEVTVKYDAQDNKVISNVATVDDEETNTVETPYEKTEIKEESSIEKTGTEKISSTEDEITYKIRYNASIKDFVGEGKVILVDYLPYEIDVENQYLDGGFYDAKTKTITWEEDLGAIDTYTANKEKEVNIEKEITVKYVYGEEGETLEGTIANRVEGTLRLTQKDPEKPAQDKIVLEDKKEATHETEVQIPTYIIVHHYIEGTTTKVPSKVYGEVVEDETQEGYVGQEYITAPSGNIQENYQVVSNSGNTTGTMTRTPIEVIYYYRLQPGNIVTNTITKDGTDKIINKNDKVSYTLTYTGRVENYVGNVKVEIIDYLPFAIDEAASNLNGGIYDPQTKTIRWEEEQGRVNTFTEGPKDITITKNIEVVFTEMNYAETSFTNRAQGKIILEETKQEEETPETSTETQTEFVKDVTVEKVWDDNEDIKGRRPDSVTVQLTANGNTIYNNQELEKIVLSDENNWTHTFQDLPKYTEHGQEINYSVVETETNAGDLEYYNQPDIQVFNTDTTATVRVTNSYKLMDTNLDAKIEKTGTDKITSSAQEVNYNIKYNASIKGYIGTGLVTITDYLPYAIDESKSNLDGGTYDALTNTITWTQKVDHINTYTDVNYKVAIEKNISVVFTNLDATAKAMVNRVTGRIDLYENETTNTQETTYETQIEIPGNVIVKYVDRNTGTEIAEGYELTGLAGDSYRTEQKNIYGYTYVESTNNTSGNMIEGTIEVIYYYERTNAGGVIVHYQDEEGNKLADDVTINGKVQDPYTTEQKEIPNYDFDRIEGQPEGELTEGVIEVTYIYKKIPAKVIVQYLEKDDTPDDNTDNVVLAAEETIEGFSGDEYTTERKEIENYKPADPEPENATGTMTSEDIYVTYYYERKPSGIVTVKYVDVDTNEEILHKVETEDGEEYVSYREQMSGLCGLEYTTEQKNIPYYNFVEELRPTNAKGIYTEEDIEVIYYYRKQEFNLSVNKQIARIIVNEVEHSLKEDLNQIDVVASKVQETDIVVTYKIVVSNPGEIEGTAKVIESIPEFFRTADGTSSEWTENGKSLEAQVTLQPGETKELTVVLRWIRNSNNFGLQINTVALTDISNPANYEETNLIDNKATAEVIFSVKTGGIDTAIIIGTALIVMVGALMITIYLKERRVK